MNDTYEFAGQIADGKCLRCGKDKWTWVLDSLAQFCDNCGFVRVKDLHSNTFVGGATLQEWAKDQNASNR